MADAQRDPRSTDTAATAEEPADKEPAAGAEGDEKRAARTSVQTGNSAADNYGQLVQDAVIYGGLHFHGEGAEGRAFGAEVTRLVRAVRRIDPQRISVIRETFAPPAGYAEFDAEFRERSIGVITGKPGTGRATTAVSTLDLGGGRIEECTAEAADNRWRLDRITVDRDRAYLLDTTAAGIRPEAIDAEVRLFADRVRAERSRLVVIAERWNEDPADNYAVLPLRPAPVEEVCYRHLTFLLEEGAARRWLSEKEIRALLDGGDPAYGARVAKQIERVVRAEAEADFAAHLQTVLGIFRNWGREVREWFEAHESAAAQAERNRFRMRDEREKSPVRREELRPDDYSRVLFEAVAVLEGCPSDAVLVNVDRLAEAWKVQVVLPSPISGGGLTAMLHQLGAYVDANDRIRFARVGFGDAALDHLWREYPKARKSLLTWSNQAVRDIPVPERRRVAQRWLQLAERQSDPKPVMGLLPAWGRDTRLRSAVVPVMAQAAAHDELGPEVRRYLYYLADNGPEAGALDTVVAQVCGQYGKVEPHAALVRLARLADRATGTAADEVRQALSEIAAEKDCRPALLRALIEWEADEQGRPRIGFARGHLGLLLSAVNARGLPLRLTEAADDPDTTPPRLVGEALGSALAVPDTRSADAVLDVWLAALRRTAGGRDRDLLEHILVRAAGASTAANVRMSRRLAVWDRERPGPAISALLALVPQADPLVQPVAGAGGGR
ncbi:hypothetical protein ACFPZ0_05010 [Streptomonospora nanhaiensis]|uniref:hypothetical protein n=1 Tax=Streptomonospora nanhaiensis TaxID=1323731 RepID=UPI001C382110|nr:hypothetical protein [Streptomonospora nanhaiensis]MBV2364008.1 hypothetical protein [Streptomonospora nanhaiensis]MBX9387352.1 hypothetical protein [Streptomonospora nanhaiensis]